MRTFVWILLAIWAALLVMVVHGLCFYAAVEAFGWLWPSIAFGVLLVSGLWTVAVLVWKAFYQKGPIREYTQDESTATAWLSGGRYMMTTMEYTNHHFDERGFIVTGEGQKTIGFSLAIWRFFHGWVFYVAGLVKAAEYLVYSEDDGFGKGNVVYLHELLLEIFLGEAETKMDPDKPDKSEGVGLNLKVLFGMRVANVWLYLFVAPKTAVAQVKQIMTEIARRVVAQLTAAYVQRISAQEIWEMIRKDPSSWKSIYDLYWNWGIKIGDETVKFSDVGNDPDVQKALKANFVQTQLARGETARLFAPVRDGQADYGMKYEDAVRLQSLAISPSFSRSEVDITSGGKSIDPTIAGVVGAVEAGANALRRKASGGNPSGNPGNQGAQQKGGAGAKASSSNLADAAAAERYFNRHNKYPKWDPLKRTPSE